MALSGDRIVVSCKNVTRVLNLPTCLLVLPSCYFFVMNHDTVAVIDQLPDKDIDCVSLSFYGDVVYVGSNRCVIQWNVVTDAVARLEGYPNGLNFSTFNQLGFIFF